MIGYGRTYLPVLTAYSGPPKETKNSSPPRGSNSQPSDHSTAYCKSLTLYPIELGGHYEAVRLNIYGIGAPETGFHAFYGSYPLSITISRTDPYVEQANLNSTHCWKPSLGNTISGSGPAKSLSYSPGGSGLAQTANPNADNERQNRHGKRQAVDAVSLGTTG